MIGRLRGRLLEKEPSGLVVEAGGVGYSVAVPLSTFSRLDGETVDLYIHTEVRADAILLFGFLRRGERELFRKLITVQGVGPQTALAVLSGLSLEDASSPPFRPAKLTVSTAFPGSGKRRRNGSASNSRASWMNSRRPVSSPARQKPSPLSSATL